MINHLQNHYVGRLIISYMVQECIAIIAIYKKDFLQYNNIAWYNFEYNFYCQNISHLYMYPHGFCLVYESTMDVIIMT